MSMSHVKVLTVAVLSAVSFVGFGGSSVSLRPGGAEVLVAPAAPRTVRFAADDLTNHLSQVLGAAVPVVTTPTDGKVQIVVGDSEWSRAAGIDVAKLPRDGFVLRTSAGRVYVVGRDDPAEDFGKKLSQGAYPATEHATAFGVMEFLERYAGVRFYYPDEYGTIVPRKASVEVAATDETVKPRFTTRRSGLRGAGPCGELPLGPGQDVRKAWWRFRLREGTVNIPCCHGQNRFGVVKLFTKTHPEYFQLRKDGTRCTETSADVGYKIGQLCHTSGVWDFFRSATVERMRKGEKYVDVMPQDGMRACLCENCLKRYSQTNDFSLASGFCSELMWSNTVSVAEAVRAAGLDGCVTQMAYGPCRVIPSIDIPDNVKVVLAVGGPWSLSRPDIFEKQVEFIRGWSEKLKGPVSWIWTYPMKNYGRLMAHGVPQYAPRAYFEFFRRVAPYVDGAYTESNQERDTAFYNYMNYYVFARLCWDADMDVEKVLAEHNALLFGAGAAAMAKYFDRLEKIWISKVAIPSLIGETEIGPMIYAEKEETILRDIYSDAVLAELGGCLDAAAAAVPAGSPEAKRLAVLRERFHAPLVAAHAKFAPPPVAKASQGHGGALRIDAEGKRTFVKLSVPTMPKKLKPLARYRLSYFIRTENLVQNPEAKGNFGATVEFEQGGKGVKYKATRVPGRNYFRGTNDWTPVEGVVTGSGEVYAEGFKPIVWARVFGATGTVWIDDVRLEEIPSYEPEAPQYKVSGKRKLTWNGLSGRVAPLERVTWENAAAQKGGWRLWRGTAWRNERVNAQVKVWSDVAVPNLRCRFTDFVGPKGAKLPAEALSARFVRNVLASANYRTGEAKVDIPAHAVGDILDDAASADLPEFGFRAIWVQMRVPADAAPGGYRGQLVVSGDGVEDMTFDFRLNVLRRTLPAPKDWKFFLDLWQSPHAVARRHHVEDWSEEHWKLMDPLLRELGDAGQKTITVPLKQTPVKQPDGTWRGLVVRTHRKDGTWAHDFSLFDRWVEFAKARGLGPQIHCYSIAERRQRNHHVYVDEATDKVVHEMVPVLSERNGELWRPFFRAFAKHLKEKGWLDDTYLALDENTLEETKYAVAMARREAPEFKIAFACDRPAADFLAVGIENFSQALRGQLMDEAFLKAVKERAADPKLTTTYYICNFPQKPNSWVTSPLCESAWTGLYAAAKGYSGLLRWAAWSWYLGVDPLWDASCPPRYDAGEAFLMYPGMRSSTRWEMMRDSIENAEKIRILRQEGQATKALEAALSKVDFKPMPKDPDAATRATFEEGYRQQVADVLKALDEIK